MELVCSCCPVYLPPSKSRWPCLPLASGFWKFWPDWLFVLQPHTRPYFSRSGDNSSESVATREAAQSREAETAGCGSSTPRSLWFSGLTQQTAKAGWSPHPRRRLQEQREPHRGQSSAAPLHARPGRHDAAAAPGGEAQPIAEGEPLLAPVPLVSVPRPRYSAVTAPSAVAPFGNECGPSLRCTAAPCTLGRRGATGQGSGEQGWGGNPGTWWRRYRVSVPCCPQPLQGQKTGSGKAARGNHSPVGNALSTPPLLLPASPELLRNSQF